MGSRSALSGSKIDRETFERREKEQMYDHLSQETHRTEGNSPLMTGTRICREEAEEARGTYSDCLLGARPCLGGR